MLTLIISLPENTKRVHQCIFNTLGAAAGFLMKKRSKFAKSKPASQPSDSDRHTLSPTINFFTIHAYSKSKTASVKNIIFLVKIGCIGQKSLELS